MSESKIRVLLADDQSILVDGIRSVLSSCDEIEVVGIASDGFEAIELLESAKPDVVLMDIRMPNMNGVIATQEVKRRHPEVKVLILTTFDDSDYILNAINNGASGYLLKDTSSAALIDAIKNGLRVFRPRGGDRRHAVRGFYQQADRQRPEADGRHCAQLYFRHLRKDRLLCPRGCGRPHEGHHFAVTSAVRAS